MRAELPKGPRSVLLSLLLLNTCVAILIGLLVANVLQPGRWIAVSSIPRRSESRRQSVPRCSSSSIPKSVLGPFGDEGR